MIELIENHPLTHNNYFNDTNYVSNSMLNLLSKSPAYLRYELDNPSKPTQAMKFGSAFHMNVLQPKEFNKNYAILPKLDKRTKKGKEEYAAFLLSNLDKKVISEMDYEIIEQMTLKLRRDSLVNNLLKNGETEQIIVWKNSEFNVYCRGMIDYYRQKHGIIIDLKTTQDCSYQAFKKSILKFNYHKQAAYYADAVGADEFYIVAIEKTAPYLMNVFQISEGLLREGRKLYRKQLEIFSHCREHNYWPEYGYDYYNYESERTIQIIDSNILD
jgi:exodeoxyribonuclease VIII